MSAPRPGDRDDFGRTYHPHTAADGLKVVGCLIGCLLLLAAGIVALYALIG
ncbi:hypothetical protein [Streptomyces sp. SID3343]|uniref:hypothetical protein n=1 Tax=Streptomyces sp. SID3343 TaxID=2690260 RepID=UPI00136FB8A0|nr:hypothetical protein [Streptomyces sp. SID3343]MYV98068.1 hypothetical protein [Streptomyces sp. SID3343]